MDRMEFDPAKKTRTFLIKWLTQQQVDHTVLVMEALSKAGTSHL